MATRPTWTILERVPRFHDGGIAVEVKSPSGATSLLFPHHSVDTSIPQGKPYIVFASKCGALLVAFSRPGAYPILSVVTVAKGETAATIRTLPPRKPPVHPIGRLSSIGMTTAPSSGGTGFLVADLQPISGTDVARLIYFNTEGGEWREKKLLFPEFHSHRAWGRHGVLSHADKLWWSDLSWGLVCCNPLDDDPTPIFVELPLGSALSFAQHPAIEGRRVVCVSDSRIRYAEISRVGDTPSRITLWSLHADRTGTGWVWKKAVEANFAAIWTRESYARTRLPASLPALTLVSPMDPVMLCFRLKNYLFGLQMDTKRVEWVQFAPRDLDELIAWELQYCVIATGSDSASLVPLPGRALGAVHVRNFQCQIIGCSETSTLLFINLKFHPRSAFGIKMWHKNYHIGRLTMVEQYNGSGSISYSPSLDSDFVHPVIVKNVKQFLIYVPIPDIYEIFTVLRIHEYGMVDLDGTEEGCQPTGPLKIVGSFTDGNRRITFKASEQGTPTLMLEYSLGEMECFSVQLLKYPTFHSLSMTANPDRSTTIALRATSETPERTICTKSVVFTYVPLPHLTKIVRLF